MLWQVIVLILEILKLEQPKKIIIYKLMLKQYEWQPWYKGRAFDAQKEQYE